MGVTLDRNALRELIQECVHSSKDRMVIKACVLSFYKKLEFVVNSFKETFPGPCAQVEQAWELYKANVLSLPQAVYCTGVALAQIDKNFDAVYKGPKIFISHATEDSAFVEKFVTMLEQIGIKQAHLFCSSIVGYGIPQGAGDLYDYIRKEMGNDNLFVIMMLSSNYYSSPVCLNEMGAAWVKQSTYQSVLLPGFQYSEIKGAVNPRDMSFSLGDRNNRNLALNQLKERVIAHLGLEDVDHNLWERFRDKFTTEVDQIVASSCSAVPENTPMS